jgi:hypothetical protein
LESLFPIWGIWEADCENFLFEVYRNIMFNRIEFTKNLKDENDEFQGLNFPLLRDFEARKQVLSMIPFSTVMGNFLRISAGKYYIRLNPDLGYIPKFLRKIAR